MKTYSLKQSTGKNIQIQHKFKKDKSYRGCGCIKNKMNLQNTNNTSSPHCWLLVGGKGAKGYF